MGEAAENNKTLNKYLKKILEGMQVRAQRSTQEAETRGARLAREKLLQKAIGETEKTSEKHGAAAPQTPAGEKTATKMSSKSSEGSKTAAVPSEEGSSLPSRSQNVSKEQGSEVSEMTIPTVGLGAGATDVDLSDGVAANPAAGAEGVGEACWVSRSVVGERISPRMMRQCCGGAVYAKCVSRKRVRQETDQILAPGGQGPPMPGLRTDT